MEEKPPPKIDIHVDQPQPPEPGGQILVSQAPQPPNSADNTTRDLLVLIVALLIIGLMIYWSTGNFFGMGSSTENRPATIVTPSSPENPLMTRPSPDYVTNPPGGTGRSPTTSP